MAQASGMMHVAAFVLPLACLGLPQLPGWARGGELQRLMERDREAAVRSWPQRARPAASVLDAPLDHFNASVKGTVPVRYWVDTSCYKPGGPVFVHMGGEAAAGPAGCGRREREHGAIALSVEHRFYGESVPEGGLRRSNLDYLSVEQNLADTVAALRKVRSEHGAGIGFSFGGSYSGATCAWFRLTYPRDVAGCVSESGVVNAILNFTGFDEQVVAAVASPNASCQPALEAAMRALDGAFDAGQGGAIKRAFNATNLVGTKNGDADFMYAVADAAAMLDQYGRKAQLCGHLAGLPAEPTDAQRIENLGSLITRYYGDSFVSGCFYDSVCVRDTVRGSATGVGDRQWRWQKCSQLAYLQSAPSRSRSARSQRLTLGALLDQCKFMFGEGTAPATRAVNEKWGGAAPKGSNVIFINYSDDPWRRASVVSTTDPSLPFCLTTCDGCGHCGAGVPEDVGAKCEAEADMYVAKWLKAAGAAALQ